ncbi:MULTISPECIES: DUF4328 domain-containing protein [unclassified Pseudoalteromonas]|uniref:DUF4328 domain-containing protein n=1 Tax=unclassified Pseudoalteromonas TaxID=194690 RepID=UPI002098547E|nr:DUF4328 domain-containing protein [Pseudoalteromonas sp. XMcav2-N]MCO7188890.1 DUF4328 domain-containing protein [Pseudoalteromonas sp. XMcav2-N]
MQNESFKDATRLTKWVRYMLLAQILMAIVSLVSHNLEFHLLSDYEEGVYFSQERAIAADEANDQRQQIVAIFYLLVFSISGFLILKWIHRANYNARQLGAEKMEFTPGWSIGYFFIPVLSLWKPYQAMKEIWKTSHNPTNWVFEGVGSIVGIWWFLWITSTIVGQLSFRLSLDAEELSEFITANLVAHVAEVIAILLAVVTLRLIESIHKAQVTAYPDVELFESEGTLIPNEKTESEAHNPDP